MNCADCPHGRPQHAESAPDLFGLTTSGTEDQARRLRSGGACKVDGCGCAAFRLEAAAAALMDEARALGARLAKAEGEISKHELSLRLERRHREQMLRDRGRVLDALLLLVVHEPDADQTMKVVAATAGIASGEGEGYW